jgi:hypothetical protein
MDEGIQTAIETFLEGVRFNQTNILQTQKTLEQQFSLLTGEVENLSATAEIPQEKLAIIN